MALASAQEDVSRPLYREGEGPNPPPVPRGDDAELLVCEEQELPVAVRRDVRRDVAHLRNLFSQASIAPQL